MNKHLKLILASLIIPMTMSAQGWPSDYDGVMLQGFYWDSYSDTQWTNLESQADTLSKYFQLIWVPQSGYCNSLTNQMGYADIWWFDQKSAFGSAEQLKSMIKTFKQKGLLTIADVVINHKSGNTNWCDFPTETWAGHGTMTWSLADICYNDDNGKTRKNGYNVTGAADTGSDFDGSRDLDHTSENVQKNVKLYLHFLQEEMGYSGFRYDMTGGYSPIYTKMYNEDAKPQFSVGEYWMDDGIKGLKAWIDSTGKTSAAFDFQLKWLINSTFGNGNWSRLTSYSANSLLDSYKRYAVTFTDNHDTGRNSDNMLKKNIEAANAYILTMPGTPCIYLQHWKTYNAAIKKMILARRLAGVNNESEVTGCQATNAGAAYTHTIHGTKGNLVLCLGNAQAPQSGYQLACSGDNYRIYISDTIDISSIGAVVADNGNAEVPSFVTPQEGTYAYFEAPANWGTGIHVWAWYNTTGAPNLYGSTASWPGVSTDISYVGSNKGNRVYLWKYSGVNTAPDMIIFNDGSNQTPDFAFVNGGYYTVSGGLIYTGINTVRTKAAGTSADNRWYTIDGRSTSPQSRGLYIHQGRKVLTR